MAESPSAAAVAAQRIKSKEDGIKEQLAVLKRVDEELASLEYAITVELEASLSDVENRFMLLRECLKEKETQCYMRLRDAAEKRMRKIKAWREKRTEVVASAADVSFRRPVCVFLMLVSHEPTLLCSFPYGPLGLKALQRYVALCLVTRQGDFLGGGGGNSGRS